MMKGLTLRRIREVTGGEFRLLLAKEDGRCRLASEADLSGEERAECDSFLEEEVSSIVTDSRRAVEGSLFGAIVGGRADGHSFIPAVFRQGALCAVCERLPGGGELPGAEDLAPSGVRAYLRVDSTVQALGRIAAEYLKILEIPVVGITGSVGKTSTKEMIASVLNAGLRAKKTEGNFNNELGLPLTVFSLSGEDEAAVLEMGVSHFGDMTALAQIAHPGRMVITNIGTCHLEFLKDREGVFRAKTEVFDQMPPGGQVFLNGNDDLLRRVKEVHGVRPVFFGVDSSLEGVSDLSPGPVPEFPGDLFPDACVAVTAIRPLGFEGSLCTISTPCGTIQAKVPVPGIHNCSNAAAAVAVALSFGMSLDQIRAGIESAQTIPGRFRILKTEKATVIDDCYNANPVSMKSSLLVLSKAEGRRCAVLGDMGELGENERLLHREVGGYAARCVDHLAAIGPLSRSLYEAAKEEAPDLDAVWYESVEAFLAHGRGMVRPGDTVLVKASHYMQFSRIVEALT